MPIERNNEIFEKNRVLLVQNQQKEASLELSDNSVVENLYKKVETNNENNISIVKEQDDLSFLQESEQQKSNFQAVKSDLSNDKNDSEKILENTNLAPERQQSLFNKRKHFQVANEDDDDYNETIELKKAAQNKHCEKKELLDHSLKNLIKDTLLNNELNNDVLNPKTENEKILPENIFGEPDLDEAKLYDNFLNYAKSKGNHIQKKTDFTFDIESFMDIFNIFEDNYNPKIFAFVSFATAQIVDLLRFNVFLRSNITDEFLIKIKKSLSCILYSIFEDQLTFILFEIRNKEKRKLIYIVSIMGWIINSYFLEQHQKNLIILERKSIESKKKEKELSDENEIELEESLINEKHTYLEEENSVSNNLKERMMQLKNTAKKKL